MSTVEIIIISIGLAMDAFAVSIVNAAILRDQHVRYSISTPVFFGLFQCLMPVLGWLAGTVLVGFICDFAPWISFLLLIFIGGKMIYEAVFIEKEIKTPHGLKTILLLSLATSIDALAVGFSFSMLGINIVYPAFIIGIITLLLSLAGVCIGRTAGHFFEGKIEILGGIILIAIGIKIIIPYL